MIRNKKDYLLRKRITMLKPNFYVFFSLFKKKNVKVKKPKLT